MYQSQTKHHLESPPSHLMINNGWMLQAKIIIFTTLKQMNAIRRWLSFNYESTELHFEENETSDLGAPA